MSKLIIYYSFGGATRSWAQKQENCELIEINEKKKRNIFTAFIPGCIQSIKRKKVEINNSDIDFSKYENISLAFPIWANNPAPSFNTVIDMLPAGTSIDIVAVSGSGESNKNETIDYVKNKGINVNTYTDIKAEEK